MSLASGKRYALFVMIGVMRLNGVAFCKRSSITKKQFGGYRDFM
jgi:hypothetical protein